MPRLLLTNKSSFRDRSAPHQAAGWRGYTSNAPFKECWVFLQDLRSKRSGNNVDDSYVCNYFHERGHWKANCPVPKAKTWGANSKVKAAAFAAPVKHGLVSD